MSQPSRSIEETVNQVTPSPRTETASLSFTLLCSFFVLVFIILAIPEVWETGLVYGGVHLYYALSVPIFCVTAYSAYSYRTIKGSYLFLFVVIALIFYMTGVGIVQRGAVIFEWRILFYDLVLLGTFLTGLVLTVSYPGWLLLKFLRITYILWLTGLIFDALLLTFGLVEPAWLDSTRIHVWSEFSCINCMAYAVPFMFHPYLNRGSLFLRGKVLAVIGLVAVVIINVEMGARSVVIDVFAALVLTLPLYFKRYRRSVVYGGVLLFALMLIGIAQIPEVTSENLALQRLQQTDLNDEDRMAEVKSLLDYEGWYAIFGLGNGSGFPAVDPPPDTDVAAYPHLSIFAPLQKGGIPGVVVLVLMPLGISVLLLARSRSNAMQQCAATSALLMLIFSSVSGNWTLQSWFYFGVALGYCFYGKKPLALDLGDTQVPIFEEEETLEYSHMLNAPHM